MSEVIPITPAVEVRETFTPSEQLRSGLTEFLDPNLEDHDKESLRAAFLLYSWRRRVMSQERYYGGAAPERDRTVRVASWLFEKARPMAISLGSGTALFVNDERLTSMRIAFRPQDTLSVKQTLQILDTIPTEVNEPDEPYTRTLLYVELAKRSLASSTEVRAAQRRLGEYMIHPASAHLYTVRPADIVVRDTIMRAPDV